MLLGIIVISITCIIDDIITIKPIVKLSGQLLAAIIAVAFGIRITELTPAFLQTEQLKEAFSIILTISNKLAFFRSIFKIPEIGFILLLSVISIL